MLKGAAAVFALFFAVFPMCVGWVETHVGRKSDRIVGASVRFGDGQHGSFTPSRNGAAVIVVPAASRTPACSPATATACC